MSPDLSPHGVFTRRQAVQQMGLVAVGLAVTPVPGWPSSWFRQQEVVVPFTDVPDTFTGRRAGTETYPGQNLTAQDLRKLASWLTAIDDHFMVAHYAVPEVDAATYSLRVDGLVQQPLTFTLEQLRALPRVERTVVFECGGNSRRNFHGMVGNASWAGTRLVPLLLQAGLVGGAREVHFFGADTGMEEIRGNQYEQHFGRSMSVEQIGEADPILAYEMNGEPLPIVHGFPVRLLVRGWYGVANVKWLDRIHLSPDRLMGRFMARDYVTLMGHEVDGGIEWVETSVTRMRVKSAIARVTRLENQFTVFGVAWSDGTPLEQVEVQVDGGQWLPATLDPPPNPHAWTFFRFQTSGLTPGEHTLVSRATDLLGRSQPVELSLKRTNWENNEHFVRTIMV
ncbi:MAG: sulfite oxidase [Gemmatimonadetes bacterium]|nr:sulfite oxidase [Gemmatimonadota bacterium]